ncbi:hypothetical protein JTE90_008062 [Oedothorax gibbosus]|uniref:Uncharacterized protein n=1 Tax=Oedothorax gibbosus TaxID=931172 RepID=A0AAV6UVL3_9ARAC|nr:hypothetical protein JTE90_008062 [Oedothorax gibbosus]
MLFQFAFLASALGVALPMLQFTDATEVQRQVEYIADVISDASYLMGPEIGYLSVTPRLDVDGLVIGGLGYAGLGYGGYNIFGAGYF